MGFKALHEKSKIGIVGSGAMGSGIAQVAATAGHTVVVCDNSRDALKKAEGNLQNVLARLEEKQKISAAQKTDILGRITFVANLNDLAGCDLIIEAIVENLEVKKELFRSLERIVDAGCVMASNTSSLSITSIASALKDPSRAIGIHFFNPAPLMPLVEIIPGIATGDTLAKSCQQLIAAWGKTPVITKDTPGFIVNRVARPFYSEALRIYDEGLADMATIDRAMREVGGFKMGPFELMDLIGHDVNYVVTETVWKEFYYDPRFKPSLSQKRLLEAGFLGRKSGRGFYNYTPGATMPEGKNDQPLGQMIFMRILAMLVNEAADALYMGIASSSDIDLAMTKGVNYPKGLLAWGNEVGLKKVVDELNRLRELYEEDRYRASPLLKQMALKGERFS
jgi:3-hydroxybutyryl-CoA dehydrogenase